MSWLTHRPQCAVRRAGSAKALPPSVASKRSTECEQDDGRHEGTGRWVAPSEDPAGSPRFSPVTAAAGRGRPGKGQVNHETTYPSDRTPHDRLQPSRVPPEQEVFPGSAGEGHRLHQSPSGAGRTRAQSGYLRSEV